MEQAMLIAFAVFLLVLIFLDLAMVVSMLRPGDERKQMIVWKTSASTLLVTVLMLVFNVVEALIKKSRLLSIPLFISVWWPWCILSHCWWRRKGMAVNMENVIRNKRKEKGISQEELAKRCGVSRQTINAIENDKYDPTLSLAFRLARELGLTVDELFMPKES